MEGIVAKRCLRANSVSGYNKYSNNRKFTKDNVERVYKRNNTISKRLNKEETTNKKFLKKILFNIKMKLWIQSISAMCILILIISCNMLDIKLITNNKYVKMLKEEYNRNYPISSILKGAKSVSKYCYSGISKIIPDKIENKIKRIYVDIKNKFSEDNKKNVVIYNDVKEEPKQEEKTETSENNGVGVSIKEDEESVNISEKKEAVSAISSQDPYLAYIKENNIKFVMPTTGTLSSPFGAREVIFEDIDSYHTGIDIANVKGTKIVSSIDGKVTKVANNKYNGNFVEITNGKVVTKYAHMDSVSIKQGVTVKAGDTIGKMGDTGYVTGPHLHFEVVINNVKIDPGKVLDI